MKRWLAVILLIGMLVSSACGTARSAPTATEAPAGESVTGMGDGSDKAANGGVSAAPNGGEPGADDPLLAEILAGDDWAALYAVTGRLAPEMPEWTFTLFGGEASGGGFNSILLVIRDESGKAVDFVVKVTEDGAREDPNILLADANFDGYLDVMYSEGAIGARGHYWYDLLVWDAERNAFWYAEDFYEICDPVVDAEEKVIRSCYSDSIFETAYCVYVFADGMFHLDRKLVMLFEEVDDKDYRTFEIYHYPNGAETLVKEGAFYYPPDKDDTDTAELYGPDSLWKLDDPIWTASRYYEEPDLGC